MLLSRHTRRRDFITLLGGATTWPLAARAQQPAMAFVGLLSGGQLDDRLIDAVRQGLKDGGYIEGRNIAIKYRSADGRFDRLPGLAAELTADRVGVIIALFSPTAAMAAKAATETIPIVFAIGADPVDLGLVLLKEIAPRVAWVGVLRDRAIAAGTGQFGAIEAAAASFGVELSPMGVRDADEIERAITAFARESNRGLIVTASPLAVVHRDLIITLAARHKLAAVYFERFFVAGGSLICYGTNYPDQYRRAAGYVDRILKGEKPADLPVQYPTKYELVINLKTARALGLEVSPTLLPETVPESMLKH